MLYIRLKTIYLAVILLRIRELTDSPAPFRAVYLCLPVLQYQMPFNVLNQTLDRSVVSSQQNVVKLVNHRTMVHLIWTLVNVGLVLYFIVLCAQAAKLIKEKTGLFASIIFVFSLLSIIVNLSRKRTIFKGKPGVKKWTFVSRNDIQPNTLKYAHDTIDYNPVYVIVLVTEYGRKKDSNQVIAVAANSFLIGFVAGQVWRPTNISVNATDDRKFTYTVVSTLDWKLLGTTVYSQNKNYTGELNIK